MALQIKRKEAARKVVRRIGRKLARKALKALRECDSLEAVHEVRKDVKQMRALLGLARSGLNRQDSRRLTRKLKKTAEALAASRDSFVKTVALAGLVARFKHDTPHPYFPGITQVLERDCRAKAQKLPGDLKHSGRCLKKICRDFGAIEGSRSGWKVIGKAIRKTYRDGRRAYRTARETGATEDFHEWRKRAKNLYFQAGFLCGMWPEQMDALENELKKLGDCLGDAHDLSVLAGPETLKQLRDGSRQETDTLIALAGRHQRELHAKALQLGAKLYADKPALLCERLHRFWRRWTQKRPMPFTPTGAS